MCHAHANKAHLQHISVLTLFGDQDAITPLEYAADLDAIFKQNVVIARNTGHVAVQSSCPQSLVVEFFKTANVRNASACA
eukprot:IDg4467t1